MNIHGLKAKIKYLRDVLVKLQKKIDILEDRIYFSEKDKRRTVKFNDEIMSLDDARDLLSGLNKKLLAWSGRKYAFEKKLKTLRLKKGKKR